MESSRKLSSAVPTKFCPWVTHNVLVRVRELAEKREKRVRYSHVHESGIPTVDHCKNPSNEAGDEGQERKAYEPHLLNDAVAQAHT